MKKPLHYFIVPGMQLSKRLSLLFFVVLLLGSFTLQAQFTTLSNYPNLSSGGGCSCGLTFEVSTTQAIQLHRFEISIGSGNGIQPIDIYHRTGGVEHIPGTAPVVDTAHGWVFLGTYDVEIIQNNVPAPTEVVDLYLPRGAHGFYVVPQNNIALNGKSGTTDTVQVGGVSLRTTGWRGHVPNLVSDPYAFIGGIQFKTLVQLPGDMTVFSVDSSGTYCSGSNTIQATVGNLGSTQITAATLNWSVNGVIQTAASYTGVLDTIGGQGNFIQDVVLGNYSFVSGQQYDVQVWSSMPNGNVDPVNSNDTASTTLYAALDAGTYTIDPNGAGPNNFTSFTAAGIALSSGGICGPITFNIAPGMYNDHVYLNHVKGASSTQSITFDGGDTSLVELVYSSNDDTATVLVQGTDYVSFKNMTISNASSGDGWGIMLQENADHITIDRCKFVLPIASTTDLIAVIATSNMAGESNGENANYTTISNCTFIGGECGINLEGPSDRPYALGHKIINNIFRYQNDHALDLDQVSGIEILNNDVDSLTNSGGDAFTFDEIDDFVISGNSIISPDIAFDLNDANDGFVPATRSVISNNIILSETDNAFDIDDFAYVDIYHNSAVGEPAMEINDPITIDIRNNIFSSTGVAFGTDAFLSVTDTVDYNLYDGDFNVGSVNVGTLIEWQALEPTHNRNSLQGFPMFLGPRDLHINGPLANGNADATVGIAVDIDSDVRSTTNPDIGADEISTFVDTCLQAGGFRLSARTASSVTFAMDRTGATYSLEWGSCGFTQGAGTVVTGVAPLTISGLSPNACYEFYARRVCSSSSNYNDTIGPFAVRTECTGTLAGGIYTVDPGQPLSTSNFHSITEVAKTLENCGVSGAVTFNVAPGTYAGALYFPEISGSSASNTITFNGTDSSNTILYYDGVANPGQAATLRVDGCDWLTFNNFTLENGSTASSSQVILVGHSSDNLTISTCSIVHADGANGACVLLSDNVPSSTFLTSNFGDNITLVNNTFYNGDYGIYTNGSGTVNESAGIYLDSNLTISGNVFTRLYRAMLFQNISDFVIEGNEVYDVSDGGIALQSVGNFYVAHNSILSNHIPLNISFAESSLNTRGRLVVNNFLHCTDTVLPRYGLRIFRCANMGVYHNTVKRLYALGFQDVDIRNNIFTTDADFVVDVTDGPAGLSMDYNNYYATGAGELFYVGLQGGTTYTSLSDWQAAHPTLDQHSVSGDPQFAGVLDYHASGYILNNTGDSLGVLTDLDGNPRSLQYPDLGAYEFSLPCLMSYGAMASNIAPSSAEISWSQGTGTTTNNVEYGLAGFSLGSGTELKAVSSPQLLTGLTSGTIYEFYVQDSCGTEGASGWAGPFSFTTAGTAPCAPSVGLGADQQSSVGARLYWTPGDAAQWNVEYGPTGFTPGTGTYVFNNQDSSLTLSTLMGNTCYDFYVQDSCGLGYTSTWSGPYNFCTLSCNAATNLGADQLTPTGARVYWTAGSADRWNVEYGPAGFTPGNGTLLRNRQNDTLTLSGLAGGTCYDFYVQDSCGVNSTSSWSGPYNFCTANCPAPMNLSTDQLATSGARLYWTAGGANHWNVQYGTTGFSLGTGTYLNSANDTIVLTTLLAGTCYDVYVQDSCGIGSSSSWTGPYNFCTLGCSANAGNDSSIDACLTDPTFDLTPYLGTHDAGGSWVDLDGANFLSGSFVAFGTGSSPGTYRAGYVVSEPSCPNDTAIITINAEAEPNAGSDVSFNICDTLSVDLDTMLNAHDAGGTWLDVNNSGGLTGSIVDFSVVAHSNIYVYQYVLVSPGCGNDTASITVEVDSCKDDIGIIEYGVHHLQVYPNPSAGTFNIEFVASAAQAQLRLTDLSGQLVYSNTLENLNGQYKGSIDISGLAAGTYLLTIESDGVQEVVRVMKE